MDSRKKQAYYCFSTFPQNLICTTMNAIFIDHVQEIYDYVQVKTLIWLQKPSAGGDDKLIAKFMWPYE